MSPYQPGPGDLPEQFGPYQIIRPISQGGMGRVYLARETSHPQRDVALKVPRVDLSYSEELRERFLREARLAQDVPFHANLCPIYDAGCIDDVPYLTMPFLDGPSLADSARSSGLRSPREAVALVRSIAQGVAQLHSCGLVHRDIKPLNILFTPQNEPILVDYGLTFHVEESHLTDLGHFVGTADYAPPEQLDGRLDELNSSCDVYALGTLLYWLLTGKTPYTGTRTQQLKRKQEGKLTPLSHVRPEVDPTLDEICAKALAPLPEQRYPNAAVLAAELCQYLGEPVTTPRVAPSTMRQHPADPLVVEEILRLLREWGWEGAREQLQARVRATADPRLRSHLQLLLAWQDVDYGLHEEAIRQFEAAGQEEVIDWALVGQAFVALNQRKVSRALELFNRVPPDEQLDPILRGTVAHGRGVAFYYEMSYSRALEELYRAADLIGPEHFGYGRVLDSLGMVYTALNDHPTAFALYQQALKIKEQHNDVVGMALTHGQLGRLSLDWGDLDTAEQEFREDLKLAQQLGQWSGVAQMYNQLGQVYLARGQSSEALDYLNESLRWAEVGHWTRLQAFAHKDRALALLADKDRNTEALTEATTAEQMFRDAGAAEGVFHAQWAQARVLAAERQHTTAEQLLTKAAGYFERHAMPAEAARIFRDLARVRRQRGATALAVEAYRSALAQAEQSRRDALVSELEQELAEIAPLEHYRWVFQRVRGQGIRDNAVLLETATAEEATVLFVDLFGFTAWSKTQSPQVVRRTLNQLFAAWTPMMEKYHIVVNQYLGDGFMALVRGEDHAQRAVTGGLVLLETLREFNRPRRLLQWQELRARVGACTGLVVFGNVGTPRKVDYTAVGEAVNKAARVQSEAEPGEAVCVAEETYRKMGQGFTLRDLAGRLVTLKGLGEARVWDVTGKEKG